MSKWTYIVAIIAVALFIVAEIFLNFYLDMLFDPLRAVWGLGIVAVANGCKRDRRKLIKEIKKLS